MKELKLAPQGCGRKLGPHARTRRELASEFEQRDATTTYIPYLGRALREILALG